MIQAVIFDMYETLVSLYQSEPYFGQHMAKEIGIPETTFRNLWDPTEEDRSLGNITLEEVVEMILTKTHLYSKELLDMLVHKRITSKEECFEHLHPNIRPMLEQLKRQNLRIGLISNCFSEEAYVIRKSILFPYFDSVFLSYEQHIKKPNPEIFYRCMKHLQVDARNCLYVGDGGSFELETAQTLGMHALQACWYLKDGTNQPCKRKQNMLHAEDPMDVITYIKNGEEDICFNK